MRPYTKVDWFIFVGLLALGFVPIAAGIFRLAQLAIDVKITPDNARFFAAPLPVVLHIISSAIYSTLGVFQFSANFRSRNPLWHRLAGRILIPCGLIAALTGLWLTLAYAAPIGTNTLASFDGLSLHFIRLLVGSLMTLFLCLGILAIQRRDIPRHRAWMMRSFALGLGAGTQVFTHIPWFLFPNIQGELARTIFMGAGWAINLTVAEWLILRRRLCDDYHNHLVR